MITRLLPLCRAVPAARSGLPALAVLLASVAAPAAAVQSSSRELVGLINAHRAQGVGCGGETGRQAGPLAPDPRLAGLRIEPGGSLPAALKRSGYLAARTDYIELGGPQTAADAMRLLERRHCAVITDPAHAEIGVSHEGRHWRIVIARPLLSSGLGDWQAAGREVLRLTNQARAAARRCGDEPFEPAPPLGWADRLASAAHAHSRALARENRFAHRGSDGSQVSERAGRAGYAWRAIGENIAAGQGSARSVVNAWLASPGHCANIMNPRYSEMGAAHVVEPSHDSAIVWTQVLARPAP